MKRWILAAIVLGAASGCDQTTFSEEKINTQKRWFGTRARVLYRIAEDRFSQGDLDAAEKAACQAITLQEDFLDAGMLLARVDIERGRYAAAVQRLSTLETSEPNRSDVAYLLGVALEKGRHLERALASYRRAHSLDESNMDAVRATAEVLVAMGQTRRAQLCIDSYLPKAGEDAALYELAGRLAMMGKEYAQAVRHYARARDADPKNRRYMEALASAQYAAGQYGQVIDTLTEFLDKRDDRAPAVGASVYMMLGDSFLAESQSSQAFEAYFTATERVPEQPAAWSALARSALAMKDPSRAILAARRALRLDKDRLDATLVLGYALLRQGRADQAVETLTRAAQKHPNKAVLHVLLGRAHQARGQHGLARRCYHAALEIEPKNVLARELLDAVGNQQISRAE